VLLAVAASLCGPSERGGAAGTGSADLSLDAPRDSIAVDSLRADSGTAVRAEMRNVLFQIAPGVILRIERLQGRLRPTRDTVPPILDDKLSFALEITSARISIDTASLGNLLTRHVFKYPGSPIRSLRIETEGEQLVQRGVLHGLLPFTLRADVSLTPEGLIRLRPRAVRVFGIGVRGLMRFFGLQLEELARVRPGRGVRIDGDDFLLDPTAILPPPRTSGRVTALAVGDGRVTQVFGGPERALFAPVGPEPANYMFFLGARLRFGKLTMTGTDLLILDDDPSDPFDFFLDRYQEQLVAGYNRNTPDDGLIVRMPDLGDIGRKPLSRPK
jgi:hypothetical protein